MKQILVLMSIAAMVTILAGCLGAASVKPLAGPEYSAVYGNISLPDGHITNVMLYKVGEVYAPPFKSPPKGHTYTNGDFFFENLAPGKYFLVGFMAGQEAFYFNYRGLKEEEFLNEVAVEIRPGSVTYIGSYEVTGIDRNFIKSDTFDIKRSETPSKNRILTHLKDVTKGTGWDQRFINAMNDL